MIYVYRLPSSLSEGYCFSGGNPIAFHNVDWFEGDGFPGGKVPTEDDLTQMIRNKRYYDPKHQFLVLGDRPEHVFVMRASDNDNDPQAI